MAANHQAPSFSKSGPANCDDSVTSCRTVRRYKLLSLALISLLYFAVGVFDHDIWSPTEPATAGIVWNMYEYGDLAVPHINDLANLEKPPFYYWMALGVCKAAGQITPGLLRLPAAIMGFLSLLIVYWIAARRFGAATACLAVMFAASTYVFYDNSHRAGSDIAAAFFAFLCFGVFSSTLDTPETAKRTVLLRDLIFAFLLATSFYAKNFYVFLIVMPPVCLTLLLKRKLARAFLISFAVALMAAAVILPWCMEVYREGGWRYLRIVFIDNTIGRFMHVATPVVGYDIYNDACSVEKRASPFFYIEPLLVITLPWLLISLAAVAGLFIKRKTGDFRLFLKVGFVTIPLVLTLSSSKANEYLLPLSFFMFLIMGDFVHECIEQRPAGGWRSYVVATNMVLVALLLLTLPVALAMFMKNWLFLLIEIPCIAGLAAVIYVSRGNCCSSFCLASFVSMVILTVVPTLLIADPALNRQKSCRYFFESIQEDMPGRKIYIAFWTDRELPTANFYLRQRLQIIPEQAIQQILLSGENVGIIMSSVYDRDNRAMFESIPHVLIKTQMGKDIFVYVASSKKRGSHQGLSDSSADS